MEDLQKLYDNLLDSLRMEVKNIHNKASNKLGPAEARDLVNYIKLIHEILDRDIDGQNEASKLSVDELRKIANAQNNSRTGSEGPSKA